MVHGVSVLYSPFREVTPAQDRLRRGAGVPEGGEPDPSPAVHVLLRAAGGVAPGAGASSSDGAYPGGEPAAVSRGSRLPLPDGSAVDRGACGRPAPAGVGGGRGRGPLSDPRRALSKGEAPPSWAFPPR